MPPTPGPNPTDARTKVLLVEDDKFLLKILQMKFGAEGFDVRVAGDGEEALQQLAADPPALVVLDLILPKFNGFEVLAALRSNPLVQHVPVVVLSNLGQDEDIQRAHSLGAIAYLVKSSMSIFEVVQKVKDAYAGFINRPA
jgi:DNA-binding response OmpR family regulator